ncbi:gliding motility lipoprotein GldD [Lacinutrix sp. WUR7]|uniref:gliding motility lipoprotein GldD n=1 Tax=Lacinutrix sp. WUR7 TaxID=2653681 RepID=UPI00193E66B2|nr:gliding motility lipoprotein GldD [Lacinutrix sp. WUR7]QRM88424.1 gliding motility lipoprotein GldD [Lacinutrix sp. WUR7]
MKQFLVLLIVIICFSCGKDATPKPEAKLRLEYPEANYSETNLKMPFSFEKNALATNVKTRKLGGDDSYGIDLEYPALKGTIYLTYKSINKSEEKLISYLRDAQNFTQEHTQKADEIFSDLFENPKNKVYGMFYEVGGNAASQSQFYVTDSTDHFLTGSLYFYAKPNFDSILPAASYLKKDIKHIMETITWK